MKILFVYTEINVKFGKYGFQHGIAALSAYLKIYGYQNIRGCSISNRFNSKPLHDLLSTFEPDVIGFYTTHDQFRFIKKLIQEVKNQRIFIICGGPHANSTGELGHFKIIKEEASSAGVRRIKAVLE